MENFVHTTVLLNEAVDLLDCRQEMLYIDATAGGGGHSLEIAKRIHPGGRLIMLDTDPEAIAAATERTKPYQEIVTIVNKNFSNIPEVLQELNIKSISGGILFDLGVSYHQLTSQERGFSFMKEAELDMRMSPENPLSAYDIVNSYKEEELYKIFKEYGEERFSGRIARRICEARKVKKINTTTELADIVKRSVPFKKDRRIHPATRVFQALRIVVNDELEVLQKTLGEVVNLLDNGAKIVIISFHSLEDRLVKNYFKGSDSLKILTKKPITPTYEETKANPASRSAKMRAAEKQVL